MRWTFKSAVWLCVWVFALPALSIAATAAKITTAPLDQLAVGVLRSSAAEVISLNESSLSAEVSAAIIQIRADVGSEVKKGDVLLELDPQAALLQLAYARAAFAKASAQLEGANSPQARKVAQARLAQRQAQLDMAQLNLARCTLRAPFAGQVIGRQAQVGMIAAPGVALITLLDASSLEIAVSIEAEQLFAFKQASSLVFRAQGAELAVLIKRIASVVSRGSRTVEARLTFASMGAPIGTAGRVEWRDQELLLPPKLLTRRNGQLGVFWFDGKVARFEVLPSAQAGRPAQVNLPATTAIILSGREGLIDGQAVRP